MVSLRHRAGTLELASRVEKASGLWSRTRGLLGRRGLEPGQGLWLMPCKQVHTFFMRFAIDVVFLDGNYTVRKVVRDMAPWRVSPWVSEARSALELAAGAAGELREGELITMEENSDRLSLCGTGMTL